MQFKFKYTPSNASTRLNSDQRHDSGCMARGSHSFTCHPHFYPRMEWAILHAFCKHSPDGVARARWRTSESAYYSSIDPERMKGCIGPSWLTLYRMVYPHKWSPISYRSSVGQGKFTGQRLAFYYCAMQPAI